MDGKLLEAMNGNIVVIDQKVEEKTSGGLILAESAQKNDKVVLGTIISISPFLLESGKYMDTPFKVSDKVLYGMHAGAGCVWDHTVQHEGKWKTETFRIIKWSEILCKYHG